MTSLSDQFQWKLTCGNCDLMTGVFWVYGKIHLVVKDETGSKTVVIDVIGLISLITSEILELWMPSIGCFSRYGCGSKREHAILW